MKLIEINKSVPEIAKAPHKIYVLELDIEAGDLRDFKLNRKEVLKKLPQFKDVDDMTNITVMGVDGDKGAYDHSNVSATHGIVMDFRPLGIIIVYWEKPSGLIDS